jgi:hypothetical protein
MKTGKTISELAAEIQRQSDAKHDYLASTKDMRIVPATGSSGVHLALGTTEEFAIGSTAHAQIAEQAGIPKPYYDKMLAEEPELLATNVNRWFDKAPQTRMLRTLDHKVRALLSDRFRPLDNIDLAEVAFPAIAEARLTVVSSELTESRMYIKAVDPSVQRHLPVGSRMGDGSHHGFKVPSGEVIPALNMSNSEIGHGSLSILRGYLDNGCTNLCWAFRSVGLRKYHVGRQLDVGDEIFKLLTDETKSATDKAVWLQFRDTLKAALDPADFDSRLEAIAATIENRIEGDPVKVVEVMTKKFSLTDGQRSSVLKHLIQGGDLSQFGLFNAVTRTAEDLEDYDDATRFETLGGKIIELPKSEWKELARAA